jgi:hypothetical protein
MKNLYMKSAVVAAVAAACAYAGAATVGPQSNVTTGLTVGSTRVSLEGAKLATTVGNTGNAFVFSATVTTAVSHFAGDEWQLTLSNGTWSATTITPSVACGGTDPIRLDTLPTISGNVLTYTVASVSGTTSGVQCVFNSLAVGARSLSAGNVAVTFAARRGASGAYDRDLGATATANVFSVRSQLGTIEVLSALNGVVDYQAAAGKGFAADDGTAIDGKEDVLSIRLNAATTETAFSLTGTASLNIVLNAESGKKFSFLDANGDGSCTAQEWAATTTHSGRVTPTGDVTINPTCTVLTFNSSVNVPGVGGATTYSTAFGSKFATPSVGTVGQTITPMDFASDSTARFDASSTNLIASTTFDAGAWTSNGSTVNIPYMPVNTTAAARIAPVIYVTNRSLVSGPATATMRNDAGTECTVSLGTIGAQRITNISNLINDAVRTCYDTSAAAQTAGHRLNITITASLPSADTEVYSAFTVGGTSRVSVVNSSNGK